MNLDMDGLDGVLAAGPRAATPVPAAPAPVLTPTPLAPFPEVRPEAAPGAPGRAVFGLAVAAAAVGLVALGFVGWFALNGPGPMTEGPQLGAAVAAAEAGTPDPGGLQASDASASVAADATEVVAGHSDAPAASVDAATTEGGARPADGTAGALDAAVPAARATDDPGRGDARADAAGAGRSEPSAPTAPQVWSVHYPLNGWAVPAGLQAPDWLRRCEGSIEVRGHGCNTGPTEVTEAVAFARARALAARLGDELDLPSRRFHVTSAGAREPLPGAGDPSSNRRVVVQCHASEP